MKQNGLYLFALLLAVALCLTACGEKGQIAEETAPAEILSGNAGQNTVSASDTVSLQGGVNVTEAFAYTGPYVEDGSDAACDGICAVRIENTSGRHYQYLRFLLKTEDGDYTFTATTLFAGARMTVLCEEKRAYAGGGILSAEVLSITPFAETPSVHLDTLRITVTDGFVTVQNLTEQALRDVCIYYKAMDGDEYLGGITYRAAVGEIPGGGIRQQAASHMRPDTVRVVFAAYQG